MKRIYSFLILCLLVACATIPTATEKNSTLLLGEIVFSSNNYVSYNGISFIGTSTGNIQISLRNKETQESISTATDKRGFFYINLQEGKYEIERLYLEKTRSNGDWAYIYFNPNQKNLEIEKGKINNIGTIHWTLTDDNHNYMQINNSSAIQERFAKQFPKLNWNEKEWIYNPLTYEIQKKSNKKISFYVKSDDGKDSIRVEIPKDMSEKGRQQIEKQMKERVQMRQAEQALGDTSYFVKSENGLDSVLLTIPKGMPLESVQRIENSMRNHLHEKRFNNNDSITVRPRESRTVVVEQQQIRIED
jgi:hypothetical protein